MLEFLEIQSASNLQSKLDDDEESEDDTDAEATVIQEGGVEVVQGVVQGV